MKQRRTVYGEGGFKPNQADKNIVEEIDEDIPDEVVNADSIHQKIVNAIDILETADSQWATLTASQRQDAQRLTIRIVAKLARRMLGFYDKD